MARYYVSPIGPMIHPWLGKADTKFNADGLFHVDLELDGSDAEDLKARIKEAAQAALDEELAKMKPGEAKKWSLYVPYEAEVDDDTGEETGSTIFNFKQNAKIKDKKTGELKDVKIELRDSQDNVITAAVYSGSEGRIMFSMRKIIMSSDKKVGVRLDFAKVQITKLVNGGAGGFGAVEGGYVSQGTSSQEPEDQEDDGGEY